VSLDSWTLPKRENPSFYDKIDLTYGFGGMQNELKLYCTVNNDLSVNRKKNLRSSYEFLPIRTGSMKLVLFDPPFVIDPSNPQQAVFDPYNGMNPAFATLKYGAYKSTDRMRKSLILTLREIARVLEPGGIAVFKWCDTSKSYSWARGLIPSSLKLDRVTIRRSAAYGYHSTFFIRLKRLALSTQAAPSPSVLHDNGEEHL
jgi:hypothetical protein